MWLQSSISSTDQRYKVNDAALALNFKYALTYASLNDCSVMFLYKITVSDLATPTVNLFTVTTEPYMQLPPRTAADRFLNVGLMGSDCYLYPTPKCVGAGCMPAAPSANQLLLNCKTASSIAETLRIVTAATTDIGNYKITIEASLNYPTTYAFISPDKIEFTLAIGPDNCVYGNFIDYTLSNMYHDVNIITPTTTTQTFPPYVFQSAVGKPCPDTTVDYQLVIADPKIQTGVLTLDKVTPKITVATTDVRTVNVYPD